MKAFVRMWRDQAGATAVEYGLIATLIAVAVIAAVTAVGTNVQNQYQSSANKVAAAGS